MTITATPNQSAVFKVVGDFLTAVLPTGVEIIQGQGNRTPEPKAEDFVVMTPIRRPRLATNLNTPVDVSFEGSIAGAVLTVTTVDYGEIEVGATISGEDLEDDTVITGLGTGTGGTGTYAVSPSQTVASEEMSAGALDVQQATEIAFQFDVHGPASADNAQIISTLWRSDYGVRAFAAIDENVSPLHADDPRQMPFINAEKQYEDRWVIDAVAQANVTVSIPQQYAGAVAVELIDVDAAYPP